MDLMKTGKKTPAIRKNIVLFYRKMLLDIIERIIIIIIIIILDVA